MLPNETKIQDKPLVALIWKVALSLLAVFMVYQIAMGQVWQADTDAGHRAFDSKNYGESKISFAKALETTQWFLASSNMKANSIASLILVEDASGNYQEAERLLPQIRGSYVNDQPDQLFKLAGRQSTCDQEAILLQHGIKLKQELLFEKETMNALWRLGDIYLSKQQYALAKESYDKALASAKTVVDDELIGTSLEKLAAWYLARNKYADAEEYARKSFIALKTDEAPAPEIEKVSELFRQTRRLQGKSTDLPKFEPERDITDFGLEKYELGEPPKDMISQFLGFIPRLSDKLILPALLAAIYPYGLGKKLAELRHRKQTADARLYRLSNIGKHFPLWLLFIWFFMRANSFVDSLNWLQLTIKAHGAESAGALGKAEANYRYAQQVLDSSPTFCEKKVFTTFNLQNFANLLTKEHKYDEAERAFRQAAAISENESEHVRLSSVGKDYAKLLRKWGYADEANKIESSTTTPAELDEMNETLNDD